jgi:hypothetical protein
MSLLEQNKQELIDMAIGEVDEQTRDRLRQLIEKDGECRTYWEQLTEVSQPLVMDARRKENIPLPIGFHQRLTKRLSPAAANTKEKSPLIAEYWKPAISVAIAATLLALLASQWFPPTKNSKAPVNPTIASTQSSSPAPHSWAALRLKSIDSEALSVASTSSSIAGKIPSMNWADRGTWIKELDL